MSRQLKVGWGYGGGGGGWGISRRVSRSQQGPNGTRNPHGKNRKAQTREAAGTVWGRLAICASRGREAQQSGEVALGVAGIPYGDLRLDTRGSNREPRRGLLQGSDALRRGFREMN